MSLQLSKKKYLLIKKSGLPFCWLHQTYPHSTVHKCSSQKWVGTVLWNMPLLHKWFWQRAGQDEIQFFSPSFWLAVWHQWSLFYRPACKERQLFNCTRELSAQSLSSTSQEPSSPRVWHLAAWGRWMLSILPKNVLKGRRGWRFSSLLVVSEWNI